jgi:hypothetical protein
MMTGSQKARKPDEIKAELQLVEKAAQALSRELIEAVAREEHTAHFEGRANHHGYWRTDGSCSHCGSMTPAEAIRRLRTKGTTYSGADWKYGWPHKFYIGGPYPHKFYTAHLEDADASELEQFAELSHNLFGVLWARGPQGDRDLRWSAPNGMQKDGVIQ